MGACSDDCTHGTSPASLGHKPRSHAEYKEYIANIQKHLENFKVIRLSFNEPFLFYPDGQTRRR